MQLQPAGAGQHLIQQFHEGPLRQTRQPRVVQRHDRVGEIP